MEKNEAAKELLKKVCANFPPLSIVFLLLSIIIGALALLGAIGLATSRNFSDMAVPVFFLGFIVAMLFLAVGMFYRALAAHLALQGEILRELKSERRGGASAD